MLPLSDGLPARRFAVVTIALNAANLAVWILYGLPDPEHERRLPRRLRAHDARLIVR
jgi:hypothetical protein